MTLFLLGPYLAHSLLYPNKTFSFLTMLFHVAALLFSVSFLQQLGHLLFVRRVFQKFEFVHFLFSFFQLGGYLLCSQCHEVEWALNTTDKRQLITEMSLYWHYSSTIHTLNIEETVQHHEIQKEYWVTVLLCYCVLYHEWLLHLTTAETHSRQDKQNEKEAETNL